MTEEKTKEIRISIPEDLFSMLIPEKTATHLMNARKEMLLSLRSLIDARIEAIEKFEKKRAIKTRKKFLFTIEVEPSYGKYHYDGHRNWNFSCSPEEARKLNNICPRCKSKLTIGVLHRVEELADREQGFEPKEAVPYKSLIPLSEIISIVTGNDVFTKRVWGIYNQLIARFSNEFNVLLTAEKEEIRRVAKDRIADLVIKNREGRINIIPGYDGVYGKPVLESKKEGSLREFLKK